MKKHFLLIIISLQFSIALFSQSRKTPLMGWASWNTFFVEISNPIIKGQADVMVSSGLSLAGYTYINIDDGFFYGRDANGNLQIDPVKFPNGMKPLVEYIHSKGLKAGFYSEAGANTCGSQYNNQTGGVGGGMYNHDQQDADLFFTNWGFDFLKVDYCGGLVQKLDEKTRYTAIKTAIDNTGRTDVNFNVCRWQFPGTWVTKVADSWRIATDISFDKYAHWDLILKVIDSNTYLAAYCSPGHYNDMDMLEIGRGLSIDEDKSHFSLWCILSSPLVLGNDLTLLSAATKTILTNEEAIAVNQDTTGVQAQLIKDNGAGLQVWAKPLNGKQSKERAVVFFNRTSAPAAISVKWKDLNLAGTVSVRNLWTHTDLGIMDSMYSAVVPTHGVVMLKVAGTKSTLQETFEAEYGWINNFNLSQNSVLVADQGKPVIDAVCSGRARAGWLGKRADNYLEFRDVYANQSGTYNLSMTYISGENRTATFSINGKDTTLTNLNSGGWSTLRAVTFPVQLNEGYNVIRISNATGWLPDIDKIQLDLNKYEMTSRIQNPIDLSVRIHPNPCSHLMMIEADSPVKDVCITSFDGKESLRFTGHQTDISRLTPGIYFAKVNTGKGYSVLRFIKN